MDALVVPQSLAAVQVYVPVIATVSDAEVTPSLVPPGDHVMLVRLELTGFDITQSNCTLGFDTEASRQTIFPTVTGPKGFKAIEVPVVIAGGSIN